MSELTVIFPNQLFKDHPAVQHDRTIILIEEFLYFRLYKFHKQKIAFHRASMKHYERLLMDRGLPVKYVESTEAESDVRILIASLTGKVKKIHAVYPNDNWLQKKFEQACTKAKIDWEYHPNPMFLNNPESDELKQTANHYNQTSFYINQRKTLHILTGTNDKPAGGKWTYDEENRAALPKGSITPPIDWPIPDKYLEEAVDYTRKHFPNNYGELPDIKSFYPVTHQSAEKWLVDFINERFENFGKYQDSITVRSRILYHGVLSPLLNSGLLTPVQVLEKSGEAYLKNKIPLNSYEGFIRQIIGWREYVMLVYERSGTRQRTTNFWRFRNKMPDAFWEGTTGIMPVDHVISKVKEHAYNHHIERLMILGNFMLLCEINPDDVYEWFMTWYIDAYDWVMVPNVYGMSQYADGGLMSTKPYVSSSNYIRKMSDYKNGSWQHIWDSLFWRFLDKHRKVFETNQRMSMLIRNFDKMTADKKIDYLKTAGQYLENLHSRT
ncbi:cryptochrome/photolyase family protein [Pedobacter sp. HMF7647]|uniref:Cryptochrome/photolyase family protein n=1 Tax=Hufsiella arboris TaxID=2695275 RepID=A0A7K1YBZ7_9SPHI|nr:cryptochrome/photolyase family protein [Hufsiella arboris]MXV51568.1 cryptochrome/photolyase family protein [Hufsiella arboris]